MGVTAHFNLEAGATLSGEVRTPTAGVSATDSAGLRSRLTYELQATPEQYQGFIDDPSTLPNPLDPSTLPVGSSMLLASEGFHTQEASARFRGLFGSDYLEERQGASIGVARVDENTVRVSLGPHHELQRRMRLGFDVGGVGLRVGVDANLAHTQLQSFDLDLSTPEGRQAYDALMQTGDIPGRGDPGVENWTRYEQLRADHALVAGVSLGDNFAGITFNDAAASRTRLFLDDGTVEQSVVARSRNDMGIALQGTGPADGPFQPDYLDRSQAAA